jgi:hypothetical protein
MARRGTAHSKATLFPEFGYLNGGLDLSEPPWSLHDSQLVDATNFYYNVDTGKLTTRPGLVQFLPMANRLVSMDIATVAGEKYLIAARVVGSDLVISYYKYSDESTGDIGTLNNWVEGTKPVFENFIETAGQEALYFTWGGVNGEYMKVWDGTTLSDVTNSPTGSKIVIGKSGRLFTDDGVDTDVVKASGILDETEWDYPFGLFAQVGWPDGDAIKAIGVLGNDLIVFKGDIHKKVVSLKGVYPEWKLMEVARGTSVINQFCIARVGRDLVLLDADGVNSLSGVVEYGDLKIDPVGKPIVGPLVSQLDNTAFVVPWPKKSAILMFPKEGQVAYVLHYSRVSGNLTVRWTSFYFDKEITCGIYDYDGDILYLGTRDGIICTLDTPVLGDTTFTDVGVAYEQSFRTKIVQEQQGGSALILKRLVMDFTPLALGSGVVVANTLQGTRENQVASFSITPDTIDLDDGVTIDEDVGPIGLLEGATTRLTQRVRSRDIQIGATISSGAFELDSLHVEFGIVGRR